MFHCGSTGVERTPNYSQHTKLSLEKKILPPLLPGFELATLRSRVRRSYQQAIPRLPLPPHKCLITTGKVNFKPVAALDTLHKCNQSQTYVILVGVPKCALVHYIMVHQRSKHRQVPSQCQRNGTGICFEFCKLERASETGWKRTFRNTRQSAGY